MPLVQTRGAASAQGFGEFAQVTAVNYVEDVFRPYLYTGNSTSQTITNGIDLSTKGGLVWTKERSAVGFLHQLYDSARGITKLLISNNTSGQTTTTEMSSFNSNGYSVSGTGALNYSTSTFVGWTFRKQPKFFDIVTYTGTGVNRSITHSLGSTPGFVIVKRTDTSDNWYCGITAFGGTDYLVLNTTAARATDSTVWNNTVPTSAVFTVGTNAGVNANGGTYVAYLFANNAGGFGLTGTDSVISTTLVSSAGSGNTTVNLGFEPQFLMLKKTATTSDWFMYDNMRGMTYTTGAATLLADTGGAETTGIVVSPTAEGFTAALDNSFTYFCLAIRRGPMKVPTLGTTVYNAIARSGNSTSTSITGVGFVPDLTSVSTRTPSGGQGFIWQDRLRGATRPIWPSITQAETTYANEVTAINQDGITVGTDTPVNQTGYTYINHFFGRAPSFFDEVCYTNTGSSQQVAFTTLGTTPEIVIYKARGTTSDWYVLAKAGAVYHGLKLNTTAASAFNDTAANLGITSTYFDPVYGWGGPSSFTYVAYFFATCAGVSKVGSYTGNGTTQTINCGFGAGGARFVMIKRTDSTGNWYIYDSTRGMTTVTDPYLWLNDIVAEVATLGSVTAVSTGFALDAAIVAAINTNAASYIFLAIA